MMSVELTVGSRWKSSVCETEVVVVRAPAGDQVLGCGGAEMVPHGSDAAHTGVPDPELWGGTLLGKRYGDDSSGIELLCTKPGAGTLTLDGEPLPVKGAKPLPSSD
jgi:hypothetical protein